MEAYPRACAFRVWNAYARRGLPPLVGAWPLRLLPLLRPSRLGSYRCAYRLLSRNTASPRQKVAVGLKKKMVSSKREQYEEKAHGLFPYLPSSTHKTCD